jgi:2-polyprenyl-3-methyl-5-hydroxy-6-metoxy-1,4-benzoquinol methylase
MSVTAEARRLFTEKHATYARFIGLVRYPQGLRAFFLRSPLLQSKLRVLDAGCGTGVVTLAIHDALVRRGLTLGTLHAFDLTPTMLERFHCTAVERRIVMETRQADVLDMDRLPATWTEYDLIVSASMLEYVPRDRLADALAGLRGRLADTGHLVIFVTRQNWLTRPLIGRWWQSNLYKRKELLEVFRRAEFSQTAFSAFPFTARYLAAWGYIIEARK